MGGLCERRGALSSVIVLPGMGKESMEVKTGVMAAADVNMPSSGGKAGWFDLDSPATWSVIWTVGAFLYLCMVLRTGRR